jgi:uncharacterized protein YndB with AHSA1/START domain
MQRHLAHPPAKVWRAITEPPHVAHWFPFAMEFDLQPDAKITFVGPDGEPSAFGVITELQPPRLLAFSWGEDHLRWELHPDGDGTLLTLQHTFDDRAGAASFAAGWHTCIQSLDASLAGHTLALPRTMAELADLHEDRIALFGLDRGTTEDTPDGWRVRFERQLTRPVDHVWTTLTAGAELILGDPPPTAVVTDHFPAGPITEVDPPRALEYPWLPQSPGTKAELPGGRIRWELRPGTGDGARLVLTHTGPAALNHEQEVALTTWHDHIESLAHGTAQT